MTLVGTAMDSHSRRPGIADPRLQLKYRKANVRGRFKYRAGDTTIHINKNKARSYFFDYYAEKHYSQHKHFEGSIQVMQTMYVALGNYIRIWLHDYNPPPTHSLHRMHKTSLLYEVQAIDCAQEEDEELDQELSNLPLEKRLDEIKRKDKIFGEIKEVEYVAEAGGKYEIIINISIPYLSNVEIMIKKEEWDLKSRHKKKGRSYTLGHMSLDLDELRIMHRAIGDCLRHNPNVETDLTGFFREKSRKKGQFSKIKSTISPYPSVKDDHDDIDGVDSVSSKSSDDEENGAMFKSELQKAKTNAEFRSFLSRKNPSRQTSDVCNRLGALENLRGDDVVSHSAVDMWIRFTQNTFTEKQASEIILLTTDFCSTLTDKHYSYKENGIKLAEKVDFSTKKIKLLIAPFRYDNGNWALLVAKFNRDDDDDGTQHANSIDIGLLEPRTEYNKPAPTHRVRIWIERKYKFICPGLTVNEYVVFNEIEHFPKSLFSISGKKQKDEGIFVCMYISYICSSVEMDFLPTDIKFLRKWVEFKLRSDASILPLDDYPPNIDKIVEEVSDSDSGSDSVSS
jgi:hypothetical protein